MLKLHNEGMTYREIGKKLGLSHQRVCVIIGGENPKLFRPHTVDRCVYSGIRKWLNANKISNNELSRRLYGNANPKNAMRISSILKGKTEITKSFIDKIIEITGLTYEKAFESEVQGE